MPDIIRKLAHSRYFSSFPTPGASRRAGPGCSNEAEAADRGAAKASPGIGLRASGLGFKFRAWGLGLRT